MFLDVFELRRIPMREKAFLMFLDVFELFSTMPGKIIIMINSYDFILVVTTSTVHSIVLALVQS